VGHTGESKGTGSAADVKYSGTGNNVLIINSDAVQKVTNIYPFLSSPAVPTETSSSERSINNEETVAREALKFFFSDEGILFRDILVDEVTASIDALSRYAAHKLVV